MYSNTVITNTPRKYSIVKKVEKEQSSERSRENLIEEKINRDRKWEKDKDTEQKLVD